MAVENVKRVWLVCSQEAPEAVLRKLYSLRLVHLERADAGDEEVASKVTRMTASAGEVEARVARLKSVLSVFDTFCPSKKDFLSGMLSLPLEISAEKAREAVLQLNEEELAQQCEELSSEYEANQKRMELINGSLASLGGFSHLDLPRPPAAESPSGAQGFVKVQLGLVNASQVAPLADAFEGADWGAAEVPAIAGSRGIVVLAYLASHAADAADLIGRVTFEPLTLPPESSNLKDHLQHLSAERDALGAKQQKISERIKELAKLRDLVIGALGAAENDLHRIRAIESFAVTGRMAVLSGYVRTDDLASLQTEIDKEPDVAMVHEDPDPGKAPISLKQSRFMRPGQFLIKMFGMPRYGALDPSPFVLFTFLLFFGFCFGDVFYGLGLIVMGGLLCRRLRHYPGLRDFFMLLTYAGFSSVIIGALTGSWAADLLKYLGPLEAVPRYFAVFDPLAKPVIALLIVIGIGVTNQLYAMILRIKDSLCRRDPMGVLDGVLWLMFLPALILIMVTQMSEMPAWVGHVALALLVVSSIGLVLTQGREQKGIAAKAITGVVSLYGILGSYGGVTFIGDILSYSRLLALGLTTFIVGISFNIIAALLKDVVLWGIPVGILLFIIVVLIGHVFNFFIGILGAFVHSGRLVFVEFFGRFYSAEGKPFEAYGPMEDRVKVTT